jgi:hypothetical protein
VDPACFSHIHRLPPSSLPIAKGIFILVLHEIFKTELYIFASTIISIDRIMYEANEAQRKNHSSYPPPTYFCGGGVWPCLAAYF